MLVSDGVPSRGNRKNIFSTEFTAIGLRVGPHEAFKTCTVMDFASKIGEIGAIGEIHLEVE